MEIDKSNMTQIEALVETMKMYFGKEDEELNKQLEKLTELIKEEKERNSKLSQIALMVANRI